MYHYLKPILMGEVIVKPGDWVFGDIDGVITTNSGDQKVEITLNHLIGS